MSDFFNKNNKKILITLFILFLIGEVSKCLYDKNKLNKNCKITYCTIKKKSKFGSNYFVYNVNGKRYSKIYTSNKLNYINGEKFLIEYDSSNPKNFKVLLNSPIFLKMEDTDITKGYINKIFKMNNQYYYWYSINNIDYNKIAYYKDENFKKLKKMKIYKILYWKKNPQRSILLLDESDINDVIVNKSIINEEREYR